MREKVMVRVRLPATQRTYEFRVPFDLNVRSSAELMARLLSTREGVRFIPDVSAHLMLLDGKDAGALLEGNRSIRGLVLEGVLVNGSELALV